MASPEELHSPILFTDAKARKDAPMARGVLDYFPLAIAAVAEVSRVGNEQHNPGQPMHWAKEKSTDHADCIVRHLVDRGSIDTDGLRHSAKVAWRALAMLQREIEAEQASVQTVQVCSCERDPIDGGYYDCHGADDCRAAASRQEEKCPYSGPSWYCPKHGGYGGPRMCLKCAEEKLSSAVHTVSKRKRGGGRYA